MFNAKWIIQPQYRSSGICADGVHPPERRLPGESAYFLPTKEDTGWGMVMKWNTSTVESELHKSRFLFIHFIIQNFLSLSSYFAECCDIFTPQVTT